MFTISEQFSRAAKAMVEAQLGAFTRGAQAAFDAGVCAIDFNVETVKTSLAAHTVASKELLAAKDSNGFLGLAVSHSQQSLARALSYSRDAASLASDTQAKLSEAAKIGIAESKREFGSLVDAARKAPGAGAVGS